MSNEHLSAERIQAFLDGELPARDRSGVEEHLAVCMRCAAELDAWRLLYDDLGELAHHRPHEGFSDRVMAGIAVPDELPLAARVRKRLGEVVPTPAAAHLGETTLQDFIDGALPAKQVARVETHLAACVTCSAEADQWFALHGRLGELGYFEPSEGFAERVIPEIELGARLPLAARVRERLTSLLPAPASAHVEPGRLQDFVDGVLPARQMARVSAHLDGCAACASEAAVWRSLVSKLEGLGHLAPVEGFGERVLRDMRMPAQVAVRTPARHAVASAAWTRALAYARRAVPRTRKAWAALSGMAVTPAVTVGLVFYAVFSHPTLTPGALASFVWWQITDVAAAVWGTASSALVDSAGAFGAYSLFETLAAAPLLVACGVLVYSLASALALRVLYKNLFANRPVNGRYAHVSAS